MVAISGGDKLDDALREIASKLKSGGTLHVGFLSGATYPDGTSVPLVAAVQEFGAPSRNIPPRPFFRNMVADKSGTWPEAIRQNLVATDYDVTQTLERMGALIKGQLQQAIRDFVGVPLKPATIKAKGFSKALIDHAVMLNSVDYEVEST